MQWIHQHDVRLEEDLCSHGRQQAPALLEPVGDPVTDRIIPVSPADSWGTASISVQPST